MNINGSILCRLNYNEKIPDYIIQKGIKEQV